MATAAGSDIAPAPVLVDTGALRIEELRGPDQLPDNKKLQGYGDVTGDHTLQPTTGDQVVFRVKEVGSTSDAAPQLAVLGSPQVPVGVSSALGYLHLGQVARVKLPPHLMEQTVTDTAGTIQDVNSAAGTAAAAGKADTTPQSTATAHGSRSSSQAQDRDEHQKDQQTKPQQHSGLQQQGEHPVGSHPIDVVGAAQHGAVPVHTSGSSPSSHRRHKLLPHRHHHTEDTPPASPGAQPGHSRQFSDPKIVRPKGWAEKQQQVLQQQEGGAVVSPGATTLSPAAAAAGGVTTPRTSRVAAAAAHAAAARSDNPIRRAVATSMAGGSGGAATASTRQSPFEAAVGSPQAGAKTAATAQYGALSAPIVTGGSTTTSPQAAAASSTNSNPGLSAAAGAMRPSPSPAVLPASPAISGTGAGRPPLGDSVNSPGTWSSNSTVGTPGSTAAMVAAGSSAGRSVSPAPMRAAEMINRSPSPGPSRGMLYSGYRMTDRTPTPGRTRTSSGPLQGVSYAKMSPQASTEGPLPATPHPSPPVDSILKADQQAGGVKALVSRLNQPRAQEAAGAGGSRRGSADGASATASPTALRAGFQTRAMSPPAAVAGARTAASPNSAAGRGRRGSADSVSSSSNAGFTTPPAAAGTPFYTPASNTPQSSDANSTVANSTVTGGSTMSSNSNLSLSSVNQASSRQGPPPLSLMTLEGLRSPGATATAPTAASADAMFGGAASASSTTGAGVGSVRSDRATGLSALMPQQQPGSSHSAGADDYRVETAGYAGGTAGTTAAAAARAGDSTARQLEFDSRDRGADVAQGAERGGVGAGRAGHKDSTAVLQAAADKLRSTFGLETTAQQSASSSSTREQRQPGGVDVSVLRDAGNIRATGSGESQDGKGNVTFSRWLPPGGGSGSILGAAAADARKSGSSDYSAAGSSGSSIYRSREAAAMAAALQPGFYNSTGASSGITAIISTVGEYSGEGLTLQNYPAAQHKVESFDNPGSDGSAGTGLPAFSATAAPANPAATGAPAQGSGSRLATAGAAAGADMAAAGAGAGVGRTAAEETQPGVTAAAPARVSPSKAAAAAALASFGVVEAGAPAATAVDTSGLAGNPRGVVPSPAPPPVLQLYTKGGAVQGSSAAAGAVQGAAGTSGNRGSTTVYMRPVEEALMPGRSTSSSFTGQKSSGSSFTAQHGTAQHGTSPTGAAAASAGSAEAGNAVGKDRTAAGAKGSGTAAGAGEGGGAQNAAGTTEGADGAGGVDGDGRVEYEVEVLAVVPGHGAMSGQPVLSEIAQQENITPQDVRQAAEELAAAEPHLKPPKPAKGCGGWVRRHLSLNVDAPRRAAKKGAGATGLRGCFGGGKKK